MPEGAEMAPPGVLNPGRQAPGPVDAERDASALIAKIDQLVNHKAYPEPKSLSQLVYEKTHPPFEDFERTIQDAWDVGIGADPIQRQQGGGCCGAPKGGCGPKAGATGGCGSGGGGCGCGPAAPPDRQGGGGCCGSPKEEDNKSSGKGRRLYEPNLVPADLANRVYRNASWKDRFIIASVKAGFLDQSVLKAVAERTGGLDALKEAGQAAKEDVKSGPPAPPSSCHQKPPSRTTSQQFRSVVPRAASGASTKAVSAGPPARNFAVREEEPPPIPIKWKRGPNSTQDDCQRRSIINAATRQYPATNVPDVIPVRTHDSSHEFTIKWKEPVFGGSYSPVKRNASAPPPPPSYCKASSPSYQDSQQQRNSQGPSPSDASRNPVERAASGGSGGQRAASGGSGGTHQYLRWSCRRCRLPVIYTAPPGHDTKYRAPGFTWKPRKKRRRKIVRRASGAEGPSQGNLDDASSEGDEGEEEPYDGPFCQCQDPLLTPSPSAEDIPEHSPGCKGVIKNPSKMQTKKEDIEQEKEQKSAKSCSVAVSTSASLTDHLAKANNAADRVDAQPAAPTTIPAGFLPVFVTYTPGSQYPQITLGTPTTTTAVGSTMQNAIPAPGMFIPPFMPFATLPPQVAMFMQNQQISGNEKGSELKPEESKVVVEEADSQPPSRSPNDEKQEEILVLPKTPSELPSKTRLLEEQKELSKADEGNGIKIDTRPGALAYWIEKTRAQALQHQQDEAAVRANRSASSGSPSARQPINPVSRITGAGSALIQKKQQQQMASMRKQGQQDSIWNSMQKFVHEKITSLAGSRKTSPAEPAPPRATSAPAQPRRTTCTTPVRYFPDSCAPDRRTKEITPINFKPAPKTAKQTNKPNVNTYLALRSPTGPWAASLDPEPVSIPRPPTLANTVGPNEYHRPKLPPSPAKNYSFGYPYHQQQALDASAGMNRDPYGQNYCNGVQSFAMTDIKLNNPDNLLDIYIKKRPSGEPPKAVSRQSLRQPGKQTMDGAGDCQGEATVEISPSEPFEGPALDDVSNRAGSLVRERVKKLEECAALAKKKAEQTVARRTRATSEQPRPKKSELQKSPDAELSKTGTAKPGRGAKSLSHTDIRTRTKEASIQRTREGPGHSPPSSTCLCQECDAKREKMDRFLNILKGPSIDVQELKTACWAGVPHQIRPAIWKILSNFLPVNIQMWDEVLLRRRTKYWNYYKKHSKAAGEAYEEIKKQIKLDLPRMRLAHPLLASPKILEIYDRVLFVWALRHPQAGYVQGLNDLLTPFIMVFIHEYIPIELINSNTPESLKAIEQLLRDDYLINIEADAYWCFKNLLKNIQSNYTASQPGIQLSAIQMEDLVRRVDPELHKHLTKCGIEYLQFAFRWMNNLLMRELPLNCFIRLWDTCLAEPEGFTTFYVYLYTALLRTFRSQVLSSSDFQTILMFLQNLPTGEWSEKEIVSLVGNAYKLKYAESVAVHSGNPDKIDVEVDSKTSAENQDNSQVEDRADARQKRSVTTEVHQKLKPSKGVIRSHRL